MNTLQLNNISKAFGDHQVLKNVTLSLPSGGILTLSGSNGAGKTTLLRIATLQTQPDEGDVIFEGHKMTSADLDGVGYLPEERGLYRHVRADQQLLYFAQLKGMSRTDARRSIRQRAEQLNVTSLLSRKILHLSKGQQQRMQLIAAIAHSPRLLILDEPFSGLDDEGSESLVALILSLQREGIAIIVSTHSRMAIDSLGAESIVL